MMSKNNILGSDQAEDKLAALFALHHREKPAEPEHDPWNGALEKLDQGPARDALSELGGIIARHPVQVWGQPSGQVYTMGIEAPEAWRKENPGLWQHSLALWRQGLPALVLLQNSLPKKNNNPAPGPGPSQRNHLRRR
jgi:hypothetical protein